MTLPIANQTPAPPPPHGMPWLRLAFRPFYLGAAVLAALIVPLWVAVFLGAVSWQPTPPTLLWHAHEMLFGFAIAVIVGFLMTAGKTWTGLATPRGPALGALFLLWLSARVAALLAPQAVFAVLDLALLPIVGLIFLRLLIKSRNWRNVPLALILLLLTLVNLTFHLSASGVIHLDPMRSLYAGLGFVVIIECVMAGRVVPFFTTSALPNVKIVTLPWLDRMALAATVIGLALWVTDWHPGLASVTLALAFALHLVRQFRWHPLATLSRPILWILHAAHLWLILGLGLLALAQMGLV
ncbi:MAG TPA: NnrS family protein, partial [Rhodoferax sp.]|nr:NnrS family protein [Rhodoferax sp.]